MLNGARVAMEAISDGQFKDSRTSAELRRYSSVTAASRLAMKEVREHSKLKLTTGAPGATPETADIVKRECSQATHGLPCEWTYEQQRNSSALTGHGLQSFDPLIRAA